ncbi:hypothetical protein KDL29_07970 [bacterium]|nr:hypothetical protein [bacterium]UNM09177.1 MAG: hypothetical protein H7A35_03785 [Planctomycetales bacterium]
MKKTLTLLAALLLLLTGQALAQGGAAEAGIDEEATREVTYDWWESEDWGLTMFLPEGGNYFAPEDLGIMPEDDPMSYPLIWISEDTSLPFNMVMLGALDMDEVITDDDYQYYFEQFLTNVQVDFPNLQGDVLGFDVMDRLWDRFVLSDDEGSTMVNYLTYVDDTYYSISFLVGPLSGLDESLNATVDQMWVTFMEDDMLPEEDFLLPWYF